MLTVAMPLALNCASLAPMTNGRPSALLKRDAAISASVGILMVPMAPVQVLGAQSVRDGHRVLAVVDGHPDRGAPVGGGRVQTDRCDRFSRGVPLVAVPVVHQQVFDLLSALDPVFLGHDFAVRARHFCRRTVSPL